MKSWIILIVLAIALTAAATVAVPFLTADTSTSEIAYPAPAKPEGPAPVAVVEEDLVYNFGTLPQQYTGHHAWTFKNTGAGPLELRGAGTTCSCTTADLFEDKASKQVTIQPGESRSINVSYMTKTWDKFGQSVTVATNDPDHATIILRVEGVVKPAITTIPADPSLSYGIVSNEEEILRKVALFSGDRPDMKLIRATSSNPALIGVTARPITPEEGAAAKVEKGYVIEVTLKPSSNLGAFAEEVLVETDHPMKSELRFKVAGKVTGIISTLPDRVTMRGATASGGGTEVIVLLARGRSSINFTVQSKPKSMDVAVEPAVQPAGSKGSRYRLTVKLQPGTDSGRIVDEIILKTDEPKASELKIPVDVLVQGSK